MHFSFNFMAKCAWDMDLAKQFIKKWIKHQKINNDEEPLLYEISTNHFLSLKQIYRQWQLHDREDNVQCAQHVKEMHEEE